MCYLGVCPLAANPNAPQILIACLSVMCTPIKSLHNMLILLIRSHCKICQLPTYKHARLSLLAMGKISKFSVPSPPVLMSCILHPVRALPCPPVLYIYPIESLVCFFLVFLSYTYIQTPQKRTPQQTSNPTYKLC